MSQDEARLAILFADIGGSTHLYESLGDFEARRITGACIDRMIQEVEAGGGKLVKTIGDEVMATFPDADSACGTARAIQEAMAQPVTSGGVPLRVKVGIHFGPVIEEPGGDIFGDAVNVAARMVSLANAGEILTTRQTVDELCVDERDRTRQIDHRTIRGKLEEFEIYEVIAETANLTQLMWAPKLTPERLVVSHEDRRFELDVANPALTIGRDEENDLVVADPCASRRHARLELRESKFILRDQSTNGTLVRTPDDKQILLRREELILPASGSFGIGTDLDVDAELPIHFDLEEAAPEPPPEQR